MKGHDSDINQILMTLKLTYSIVYSKYQKYQDWYRPISVASMIKNVIIHTHNSGYCSQAILIVNIHSYQSCNN